MIFSYSVVTFEKEPVQVSWRGLSGDRETDAGCVPTYSCVFLRFKGVPNGCVFSCFKTAADGTTMFPLMRSLSAAVLCGDNQLGDDITGEDILFSVRTCSMLSIGTTRAALFVFGETERGANKFGSGAGDDGLGDDDLSELL